MRGNSAELLGRLAGGIRPLGDAADLPEPQARGLLFDDMLGQAREGRLRSGLPVRVSPGMSPGLSPADLEALGVRTDLAQAEGIRRALVQVGGRTFRVDVASRTVIDAPDAQRGPVSGIDGVVLSNAGGGRESGGGHAGGPARVVRNASLLDALASVRPGVG